jgi:hypothetical protein
MQNKMPTLARIQRNRFYIVSEHECSIVTEDRRIENKKLLSNQQGSVVTELLNHNIKSSDNSLPSSQWLLLVIQHLAEMSSFDGDGSLPTDETAETYFTPYDLSNVSHPPSFARLYGYNIETLQRLIHERLQLTTQLLHRPLTPTETEALVQHTAKNYTRGSIGPPVIAICGLARAWQTAGDMRFPFLKPSATAMESMKAGRVLGVEMGSLGTAVWHGLRGAAYAGLWGVMGRFIFPGYVAVLAVMGERADVRLGEVWKAMEAEAGKKLRKGRAGASATPSSPAVVDAVPTEIPQEKQYQRKTGPWRAPPPPQAPLDPQPSEPNLDSGDRLLSDEDMHLQEEQRRRSAPRRTDTTDTPTQPTDTWSRIRASAISSSSSSQPAKSSWQRAREASQSHSEESLFTEEGGPRSREDAQREFDERLERERRGGEDVDGGGRRGRGGWD